MAANAVVPTVKQVRAHLEEHHWTKAEAKAFIAQHADLIGEASYDDWEDLSVQWVQAQAGAQR